MPRRRNRELEMLGMVGPSAGLIVVITMIFPQTRQALVGIGFLGGGILGLAVIGFLIYRVFSASAKPAFTGFESSAISRGATPTATPHIERNNSALTLTRYDIVGHSQGGVLARLLCLRDQGLAGVPAFASLRNNYRGRFHRVITIGSPHNGSLLLYYILKLRESDQVDKSLLSQSLVWLDIAQDKFSPFPYTYQGVTHSSQIQYVNSFLVHTNAKFHLIATAIDGGLLGAVTGDPLPEIFGYGRLGLNDPLSIFGKTRGRMVLPHGSDGVVDVDSQRAGIVSQTSHTTLLDGDTHISHSPPFSLFGVSENQSQTTDTRVANLVMSLLDGPSSRFGSLGTLPTVANAIKEEIDSHLPVATKFQNFIQHVAFPFISLTSSTSSFRISNLTGITTNYYFKVSDSTTAAEPVSGKVSWFAMGFGTNGVSAEGITLQVNTNDSRFVTVTVDNYAAGDVVLSASYMSTTGKLITGDPIIVVSRPPGSVMNGISLVPTNLTLHIGGMASINLWATYTNGTRSLIYIPPGAPPIFTSSNTNVASIDTNLVIHLNAQGTSTITATYNGFTAQSLISSQPVKIYRFEANRETDGRFALLVESTAGLTNVIEASTNLVNWTPIFSALNTNGLLQFYDSGASNVPCRFYRTVIP